jgi:hypothetical protein
MNRLSIGAISTLFLAGLVTPAALASTDAGAQAQLPENPVPGFNQDPNQFQAPGQPPASTPTQPPASTPTQPSAPSVEWQSGDRGQALTSELVTPFQLTYMAVRGELDEAGIGGAHYLRNQVRSGNVRGQEIVEAAVNQGFVSAEVLEDESYIGSINQYLRTQERDWRS